MQDIITEIRPSAINRSFKKRSILLYQGEVPRTAYALINGVVKVYSLNTAGEEQIAAFHVAGEVFPAMWVFDKSSSTPYYYEALTDCELLAVPKEELREAIMNSPAHLKAALDYFVTNYTGLLMRVTALEQSRASEKIMFTLYYLIFRYGKEVRSGIYSVNLHLTHGIIASLVGLTRETIAAELGKLKRQKVLNYTAQEYKINKNALERALGEDSFKDVVVR
ncbi:MAG TPA: Crp/Fnr family transcriptional regulator [Candidatus Saccharimonadales bacterium]|nr:Crp/Fnr family transcriptional regulator [Candidatus Saccharimonadales bacterium]